VKWKVAAADKIVATPGIATNGTILVGAEDEHLYAIAPDGTLLWLLPLGGDIDTTPAIARDGTIYVAGDAGLLHAFR
jgi:outer membrane protein assembly factor BamB